ncbi:hypothetical protein [Nonomuraea sp. JJY05]|jgi:hypothetical protein
MSREARPDAFEQMSSPALYHAFYAARRFAADAKTAYVARP